MELTEVLAALTADARTAAVRLHLPAGLGAGPDVAVTRVDHDSRAVERGSLFCCVPGAHTDGHRFAGAAVAAGATVLLVDHELDLAVPQLVVAEVRPAMAVAAATVSGRPSRALRVIGVTGTNGKTTTTFLLRNIFAEAGATPAVLGTLSGARTTPEAPELQRWLARQRDAGTDVVAMEVSSHALDQHRVDATWFAAAVFTNLSRDHLDYHETMEAYFDAKARLFEPSFTSRAIVNLDDPYGRLLRDAAAVDTVGYSLADAVDLEVGAATSSFRWRGEDVTVPIGGGFNVSNALAAAETAVALGVAPVVVAAGLGRPVDVPGRFENIDEGQPFRVIVDYAHTPDALERLLLAVREIAGQHRVRVLFGCGGDRDATKRPAMGAVAAQVADDVVLTADNSRHEDTAGIIAEVKTGYDHAASPRATTLLVEPDRERAIRAILGSASPGDVVVLAGKGHETTQTIGDVEAPFDDRVVARTSLQALGFTGARAS